MVYLLPQELVKAWALNERTINYHCAMGSLKVLRIPGRRSARIVARGLTWDAEEIPPGIFGPRALGEILRMSRARVQRALIEGVLPGRKMYDGRWATSATVLRAWCEQHTEGEHSPALLKRRRIYFEADLGNLAQAQIVESIEGEEP